MVWSRRPSPHRMGRVVVAAVCVSVVGASSLGAQTIGGSVYGVGSGGTGCPAGMWIQTSSIAAADGVLTSWRLGEVFTAAKLKVVRPSIGTSFDVVAEAGPAPAGTHLVRIAVRQGDQVGVSTKTGDAVRCPRATEAGATSGSFAGDPAPGAHAYYTPGSLDIPLTATIEPDDDHDGYGDETQDGCPTSASTAGACPLPTTLGAVASPGAFECNGSYVALTNLGVVLAAGSPGVVTSWTYRAGASVAGAVGLKMLRNVSGDTYLTVGADGLRQPTANSLNTYPVRIPVATGDRVGLQVVNLPCLVGSGGDPGRTLYTETTQPVGSSALYDGVANRRLDVSAVLEPDVDGDGYGDVSQDGCPSQAATAGACRDVAAPATSFKKTPRKTVATAGAKATVKLTLVSSEPGSTFQCKLDKGDYKPCKASVRLKLKKGKHTFSARAVDAAGNIDQTPVVAKITVRSAKPKD